MKFSPFDPDDRDIVKAFVLGAAITSCLWACVFGLILRSGWPQ